MPSSVDWDALRLSFTRTPDLDEDQRWSTWEQTAHTVDRGPQPFPSWVVQHSGAVDTELGVLKSGKEADAFLIERALPAGQRTGAPGESVLMVAKRYRTAEHSSFRRSQDYAQGRRVRDSREMRAMARGTAFGRQAASGSWARTEFDLLSSMWGAGLPVPYPVQIVGTEVCMEYIGDEGDAAPRLAESTPATPREACAWRDQLREVVIGLAGLGFAHGDLSAYNVLVDNRPGSGGQLVVIDVPQAVDLVGNPAGIDFLARDCRNLCTWLSSRGVVVDPEEWLQDALAAAGLGGRPAAR